MSFSGFVGAVLNTRELTYDCIATDPLVLVTPDTPRYRAMFDAGESGNALLGEPLIFREGGSGTQLAGQKFFTENGIDSGALNIVARIDNSEAVLRAVACGLGCAVVSGLAAVGAPHSLQRAIERDELAALGRIAIEQALVDAGVA